MSRLVAIGAFEPALRVLRHARVALDPDRDSLAALTGPGGDWRSDLAALFEAGIGVAGASGAPGGDPWPERGAPGRLARDPVALAAAIEGADMVHIDAETLAGLAPEARRGLCDGLAAARQAGVRIAFAADLDPRHGAEPDGRGTVIADMAGRSDIVLAGFAEGARVFGDADPGATLARHLAAGAGEVVVRDGQGGVVLSEGGAGRSAGAGAGADWPGFDGVYLGRRLAGATPRSAAEAALEIAGRAVPTGDLTELQAWSPDNAEAGPRGARRFARETLPRWLADALAPGEGPAAVAEGIGESGRRTTLVQCRAIFTLAHLGRATGDRSLLEAARRVQGFVSAHLRDADGGHRHSVAPDGAALDAPESALRHSYDQGFVLLALAELHRAGGGFEAEMQACWQFVSGRLVDPATDALWEDDRGAEGSRVRAQNPQMHMFEALLAAFEATGAETWLERAGSFARLAEERLIDPATGAVREFLGPDLGPLAGPEGTRREPGHQFEWAWLLRKHAGLRGTGDGLQAASRMERFAQARGLQEQGPLAGAPLAAVDAAGAVLDDRHLLWPLTEAGKVHAARAGAGDPASAQCARAIAASIFGRFFSPDGAPFWAMALDRAARPLGEPGLTRLLYHVAIFVTEGARAGLWHLGPDTDASDAARPGSDIHSCRRRNNA